MTWTGPDTCRLAVVSTADFDTQAGRLFKSTFVDAGINVDRVAFGPVDKNTVAKVSELGAKYVVVAGIDSLQFFWPDLSIRECHGRPMQLTTTYWPVAFPVFHPEAFLRNPRARALLRQQLQLLKLMGSESENWSRFLADSCVKCRGEMYSIDDRGVVYCRNPNSCSNDGEGAWLELLRSATQP